MLVLALIGLLAAEAARSGFPAIRDGSLPLWSLKVDGHLPEAFSVIGYAFYMQVVCPGLRRAAAGGCAGPARRSARAALPALALCLSPSVSPCQPMMMPLLREMPEGRAGIAIMNRAVHTTLYGAPGAQWRPRRRRAPARCFAGTLTSARRRRAGVALSIYFAIGLFGASVFGKDTAGAWRAGSALSGWTARS